jgi:uncharacterized membrane protein YvlD (DUF360 family)
MIAGRLAVVLLLDALALLALSWLLPGFTVDGLFGALALALLMGLANALVWPLLVRVALPFTVATLGLGALALNAVVGAPAVHRILRGWLASIGQDAYSDSDPPTASVATRVEGASRSA